MVARETSVAEALAVSGIAAGEDVIGRLEAFADILRTRATDEGFIGPNEAPRILSRHVFESIALWPHLKARGRIADVGSGAGLPGIVLACLGADVALIEAQARRA